MRLAIFQQLVAQKLFYWRQNYKYTVQLLTDQKTAFSFFKCILDTFSCHLQAKLLCRNNLYIVYFMPNCISLISLPNQKNIIFYEVKVFLTIHQDISSGKTFQIVIKEFSMRNSFLIALIL